MSVRTKRHWWVKSGVLLCVTALAAGCSLLGGGGENSPSPTSAAFDAEAWRASVTDEYESLTLPKSLVPNQPTVSDPHGLPATDTLPGLVVADRVEPGKMPQVATWTVAPDGTVGDAVTLDVGDYAQGSVVATDGTDTLIAGRAHDPKRGWVLFVATSPDRVEWKVSIDERYPNWHPAAAMLTEGRAVLVGTQDGQAAGLEIDDIGVHEFDLPDATDPDGTSILGVAGVGDRVVVLRAIADATGATSHVVNVTDDVQYRWETLSLPDASWLYSIAATPTGFLVTGSSIDDDFTPSALAWTSTDGKTWAPEPADAGLTFDGDGSTLTAVGVVGDRVQGLVNDGLLGRRCALVERAPDGAWQQLAVAPGNTCSAGSAVVLPGTEGRSTVAVEPEFGMGSGHTVVFDQVVPDAGWVPSSAPRHIDVVNPVMTFPVGAQDRVVADAYVIENGQLDTAYPLYAVEDGSIVEDTEDQTPDWYGGTVYFERSPDGTSSIAVASAAGGITAWLYPEGGSDWEESQVVDDSLLQGVAAVGDGWNVLQYTTIYTSTDGLKWRRSVDLSTVGVSSDTTPTGLCTTPGAVDVLMLGAEETTDGTAQRPVTWVGSGDSWREISLSDAPFGELEGCATDGAAMIVYGTVAERASDAGTPALWTSSDARTFRPMEIPKGAEIGDPVAVDGGFAAVGTLDGDPVLWFSDGTSWEWAPTPGGIEAAWVGPSGSDLLVWSNFGSPQATLLPGVAGRIDALGS